MTEQTTGAAASDAGGASPAAGTEPKTPTTETPQGAEGDGGEGGEGQEEAALDTNGEEVALDPSNPRGIKAAFTRQSNARKEAERKLAEESKRSRDLELRLARLEGKHEGTEKPAQRAPVEEGPKEPDPDDFETYPMGRYDPKYIDDRTKYAFEKTKRENDAAADRENAQRTEHQQGLNRFKAALDAAKTNSKDTPQAEAFLREANSKGDRLLVDAIAASDNPAALAQYLHDNPTEMDKLDAVVPVGSKVTTAQIAEFNRIVGKLDALAPQKLGAKKVTKAGAPPETIVGGGAGGVSVPTDPEEYRKRRASGWNG
jgi:hypothetical protein